MIRVYLLQVRKTAEVVLGIITVLFLLLRVFLKYDIALELPMVSAHSRR